MIQLYADDVLVYDSRVQGQALLGLTIDLALEKAGTASIVMPPRHPAFNRFISYRTVVTIYRDYELLFRGRALYPSDDFIGRRTITCEGERCFLRDGIMRSHVYQDSPANIFTAVITSYNAQVDTFKQFKVGTITVTDPNNYINLSSEDAETFADTVDKLVERCGGYIVFTTDAEGKRCINWLAEVGYSNNQVVEFGENLLDFARTGGDTDMATIIVPYGAKNDTTGTRLTIESVNGGKDYIQDDEAVALRGKVAQTVTWDDVTVPANLLAKAQQYLAKSKMAITTLELSAVDLSLIDKSIDSFRVGDTVRVRSKPHGVDDNFLLTERRMNLLKPTSDSIVLGKSSASMVGADVAGDRQSAYDLQTVERTLLANYTTNVAAQIEEAKTTLTSLINQTSTELRLEVSETYTTNDHLDRKISTTMRQLSDSFTFTFETLQTAVDENDAFAREQLVELKKYIRFEDGNILLGETGNELVLRLENDRISFLDAGAEVAYFSNQQLYILDGTFLNSLRVGKFAFIPRENGNLSLVKVV